MSINEVINYVISKYGSDILLDGTRFCSIVDDLAPKMETESKIIRRLNQENLLPEIHRVLKKKKVTTEDSTRLLAFLDDSGFSEKWCSIVFFMFGLEIIQSGSSNNEKIINKNLHVLVVNDEIITEGSFSYNDEFEVLLIGNQVRRIEKDAFYGCSNLKYLFVRSNKLVIGEESFGLCKNLKYVHMVDGKEGYGWEDHDNPDEIEGLLVISESAFYFDKIEMIICYEESIWRNGAVETYCKNKSIPYYDFYLGDTDVWLEKIDDEYATVNEMVSKYEEYKYLD